MVSVQGRSFFIENCLGQACLGAPNPLLVGKHTDVNGSDPATIDQQERCADGHANPPTNNTRCSRCLKNFAPVPSARNQCLPCAGKDGDGDTAVLFLIGILAFVLFVLLLAQKVRSKGKKKAASSTLKRTLLSHVQMISIIMSLNVQWPAAIRTVLVGISGLISVSGHTSALHCSSVSELSPADIHYATLTTAVLLPFIVCVTSVVYWFFCVPRVPMCRCTKKKDKMRRSTCQLKKKPFVVNQRGSHRDQRHSHKNKHTTSSTITRAVGWKSTRDGWITTNVYFVYIALPSVVRMSFETFQVQEICGKQYLALDDTELFDGMRRVQFADLVAIPAILLYIVVLPMLTMLYLWRQHSIMFTDSKIVFRFGLLYSGYARNRWYWEIVVVARKIVLCFIVTFGRSNELQLHFALGVLIFMLYCQECGKPFENTTTPTSAKEEAQQRMLHMMEVSSLVVLIILAWVAMVFNVSPCGNDDWHCVVLSLLVFGSNLVFVGMCSFVFIRAFAHGNTKALAKVVNLFRKTGLVVGGGSGGGGKNKNIISVESVNDEVFGASMTVKMNPLASRSNRLKFARQRRNAKAGGAVEVELAVMNVVGEQTADEQTAASTESTTSTDKK
jgi:flagellar biogenesis protein FliO